MNLKKTTVDLLLRGKGPKDLFRVRVPGYELGSAFPDMVIHHDLCWDDRLPTLPTGLQRQQWIVTERTTGLRGYAGKEKDTLAQATEYARAHLKGRWLLVEEIVARTRKDGTAAERHPLHYVIDIKGNVTDERGQES